MKKIISLFLLVLLSTFNFSFAYEYDYDRMMGVKKMSETPKQVRAKHILVKDYSKAVELKEQIESGASFEELAQEYSLCPSKAQGGDLGYFGRGQMVKPFEDAAFMTEPGKVSDPVQTQFGWHLIKVTDKK